MQTIRMPFGAKKLEAQRFTTGRRAWDEWIGNAATREKRAWCLAGAALVVAGIAVWDASNTRGREKLNTLVIERDAYGNVLNSATPEELRPLTTAQIKQRLEVWVFNARSVMVDATALRRNLTNVYAQTRDGTAANAKLKKLHIAEDPREAAKLYTRYVYRQVALENPNSTWQVDWCEAKTSRDGEILSIQAWRGWLYFTVEKPVTVDEARKNPDGFWVEDVDWNQVSDGPSAARATSPGASTMIAAPQACL